MNILSLNEYSKRKKPKSIGGLHEGSKTTGLWSGVGGD